MSDDFQWAQANLMASLERARMFVGSLRDAKPRLSADLAKVDDHLRRAEVLAANLTAKEPV